MTVAINACRMSVVPARSIRNFRIAMTIFDLSLKFCCKFDDRKSTYLYCSLSSSFAYKIKQNRYTRI